MWEAGREVRSGKRDVGSIVRGLAVTAAVALAVLAAACGDDGDDDAATATAPAATATPQAATATPQEPSCPVHDDICAHATALEVALQTGDIDAIIGATQGQAVTCAGGAVEPLSPTWTLCEGAAAGEVRYGVQIAGYQSEGRLVTIAEISEFVRNWRDDEGAAAGFGELRARTIGCSVADPACDRAYALVFTLGDDGMLLNLNFLRDTSAGPQLSRALTGLPSLNSQLISGGEHPVPLLPFDDPRRPVSYVPVPAQ